MGWKSRQEAALGIHPDTDMLKVGDKVPSRGQLSPTQAWEGVEYCRGSRRLSTARASVAPVPAPHLRSYWRYSQGKGRGTEGGEGPLAPHIPLLRILPLCPPAPSLSDQSHGVLRALLPCGTPRPGGLASQLGVLTRQRLRVQARESETWAQTLPLSLTGCLPPGQAT